MTEETARLTNFKSAFKGMTAASQEAYVKTDISNAIAAIEFFHPQSN